MNRKQRRLILIGSSLGVLAIAAALVLSALKDSIVFFNSPTDIAEKHPATGTRMRIGGLVKPGSLQRGDNLQIRFDVTDGNPNGDPDGPTTLSGTGNSQFGGSSPGASGYN